MLRLRYRELLISILVSPLVIWKSGLFRNRTVAVLSKSPVCFFFLDLFIYFLAVVGLCCHMQAFSSWDERGLLSSCGAWVSYCGGFSCCRAWALDVGSEVVAHRLSCSAAHAIFPHQGPNCVLCIARQIFNHWTTRETPQTSFLTTYLPSYLV